MATVTFKGSPIDVAGSFPTKGQTVPNFKLVSKELKDVSLAEYAGKRKVLNIVPSLDTSVCAVVDAQVQREGGRPREHGRAR